MNTFVVRLHCWREGPRPEIVGDVEDVGRGTRTRFRGRDELLALLAPGVTAREAPGCRPTETWDEGGTDRQ
ncbi:MAG: hypothetical protein GC151_11105 [Betaproteobacteria bacterium]|nr:hypothetical protein [Betaproteobacteria bacterium]